MLFGVYYVGSQNNDLFAAIRLIARYVRYICYILYIYVQVDRTISPKRTGLITWWDTRATILVGLCVNWIMVHCLIDTTFAVNRNHCVDVFWVCACARRSGTRANNIHEIVSSSYTFILVRHVYGHKHPKQPLHTCVAVAVTAGRCVLTRRHRFVCVWAPCAQPPARIH